MYLPKIPYKMAKNRSQPISMRGINYTNVLSDGDIADSKNISARSYPYITTRNTRAAVDGYNDVTALTVFQGKFVVLKGKELYYDGEKVGDISPGEKQFAVINTKLVIMPDKVYLDGVTRKICNLGASVAGYRAVFTSNSVTLTEEIKRVGSGFGAVLSNTTEAEGCLTFEKEEEIYSRDDLSRRVMIESLGDSEFKITPIKKICTAKYTPNSEVGATKSLFITVDLSDCSGDEINAVIDESPEPPKYMVFGDRRECVFDISVGWGGGYNDKTKSFIWPVSTEATNRSASTVEFFVPDTEESLLGAATNGYVYLYTPNLKNPIGGIYKGGVSKDGHSLYVTIPEYEGEVGLDSADSWQVTGMQITKPGWDIEMTALSEYVGYKVYMRGATADERKQYTVKSVSEDGIIFNEAVSKATINGNLELFVPFNNDPNIAEHISIGDYVFISGSKTEKNNKSFCALKIEGNKITTTNEAFVEGDDEGFVEVTRRIPDFDYICESDNRIWGCSNADRTIYASALGDPTNFFDYSGESTDSFAVAVGSPEPFTACHRYGGGVLFFKEMKIHKMLGSYPEEYTLYSYDMEGVQEGCDKSLVIINEVLYYKGIHGIFAYNGSPTLISANFGSKSFFDAVAGHDGDTYYVSMRDDERRYLFAYETKYGMWVLEDDVRIIDFARIGGKIYMLHDNGKIYLSDAGDGGADIDWHIQFTPFYETISGKKSYSRIVLRLELPVDSYLVAEVKTDGGVWREAGKVVGKRQGIMPVQIPINRCDRFEIRLSGRGPITIHSMVREFFVGGDK